MVEEEPSRSMSDESYKARRAEPTSTLQLDRELQDSESRFHALASESSHGVLVLGTQGVVVFANCAAQDLLGTPGRPLLGQHVELSNTAGNRSRLTLGKLGGPRRTMDVRVLATTWEGKPATLAILRDDLNAVEFESRESSEQRDLFLAMLSHELRNPLAAILSAAQLMWQRGLSDPALLVAREIIERQSRQMSHLLDDLLDVLRVSQGKIELRRELLNLQVILHEAMAAVRDSTSQHDRSFEIDFPAGPLVVHADRARLHQVFVNLLTNAIKYTPATDKIGLTLSSEDQQAVVVIWDEGIGIAAELLESIFEPFIQAQPNRGQMAQGGLGIGLALVRSLVELHAGQVEARSAGRGHGSKFFVSLPITSEKVSRPSPVARPRPTGLRIAIIEDNHDAREMLQALLELEGHQIVTADEGEAGLALIQHERPDVALVDIGLPKLDGFEIVRRIRGNPQFDAIYLVALTGYGQVHDRQRAMEAGFDAHEVKPIEIDRLLDLLGRQQAAR